MLVSPRVVASSNPGLELANAFGVGDWAYAAHGLTSPCTMQGYE